MGNHINYFRVGRLDDIRESGWVKVRLMGWEIAVFAIDKDFVAVEINGMKYQRSKSYLPNESHYSNSGAGRLVDRFLMGPSGMLWGRLHQFPIRIEDDYVFVGITGRIGIL
jgi:hypothetical protein